MTKEQKAAVFIAALANQNPFMWGDPGRGKSSFVRNGFQKLDWAVKVLRVNNCLPHHLAGSEMPDPQSGRLRNYAPEWVFRLNEAEGKAVLILDDLTFASPTLQLSALGLLDPEHQFGEVTLNARVIAASNHDSKSTPRHVFDAATANRCVHINITGDADTFREDVLAGFPAPQMPELRKGWREGIKAKANFYTEFLCTPEGMKVLNAMPEKLTPKTIAWPSERSWEMCWTLDAAVAGLVPSSVEGVNIPELKRILLMGCVGEGAYQAFVDSFRNAIGVRPETVLKHGKKYKFPEGPDRTHAILVSIVHKLTGGFSEQQWVQAWDVAEGVYETQYRDLLVPFTMDLIGLNAGRFNPPEFYDQRLKPMLDAVTVEEAA